ncbi:MAG TPA: hypothetical protein VMZ51_08130 [Acidimicrobiales bacterium]|nr:hypothetical protein [Acidimicrobiales bacterium]
MPDGELPPEALGDRPPLPTRETSGGDPKVYEAGVVSVDFGDEDDDK